MSEEQKLKPKGEQPLKLSVLMPVYNEEYTVDEIVRRVLTAPLPDGMERELVIVEDCSTDGTRARLQELAQLHSNIKLICHERNKGKGAGIRTAIENASGDVAVIQDADMEYDPAEYCRLLKPILSGDADVVYGSRFASSEYRRVLLFWHSMGNRFLTMLSNFFTDLDLTDMETCYKMARLDIFKSIPIRCNRFGIEPEITAKFAKRGCRIYEVPVSYRGRTYHEGKKITWVDGLKALWVIFYFWLVDDLYDEKYGRSLLHQMSGAHRLTGWMADTIRPWIGRDVLEIGAGMGSMTHKLLPRNSYAAADIDPLHLHFLRNVFSGNPRVKVVEMDVSRENDFQAAKEKYDTVVCLNVLEHLQDDGPALKNIFNALKPGGRACLLVPRNPALFGSLDGILGHLRRYDDAAFVESLKTVGFEIEKTFTFNRIAVPAWHLNSRILKRKCFGRIQMRVFDSLVFLWRRIDSLLPWNGISLVVIASKPGAEAPVETVVGE